MIDIKKAVDRFLGWSLPQNFSPDCYISFDREKASAKPHVWPVGTNLFTADQARAMFEHCLDEELKRIHEAEMPVEPDGLHGGMVDAYQLTKIHQYAVALKAYAQRKDAEAREQRELTGRAIEQQGAFTRRIESLAQEKAALIAENDGLRKNAVNLWMLLDDIDTLDDACKGNDAMFRKKCYEIQRKRFSIISGAAIDNAMKGGGE